MTGIDKVTFAKCNTRALPLDLWPETDRTSWIAACQPPARLKPGGRAGHLGKRRVTITPSGTRASSVFFSEPGCSNRKERRQ